MKHSALLALLLCAVAAAAQVAYERGHYVDNDGERHEGYVLNEGWSDIPTMFKFSPDGRQRSAKTVTVRDASEFGVGDVVKYVRAKVPLDVSRLLDPAVPRVKEPAREEFITFLRVLIEGEASLYEFEERRITEYYFDAPGLPITPLVYNLYQDKTGATRKNARYRQQLTTGLHCDREGWQNDSYVKYDDSDLAALFVAYNRCHGVDYDNYFFKSSTSRLRVFAGVGVEHITASYISGTASGRLVLAGAPLLIAFDPTLSYTASVTAEYTLPLDDNRWSILVAPLYRRFRGTLEGEPFFSEATLSELNLPVGLRYYVQPGLRSRVFAGAYLSTNVDAGSNFTLRGNEPQALRGAVMHWSAGVGYEFAGKLSAELRYSSPDEILRVTGRQRTAREIISFNVAYRVR